MRANAEKTRKREIKKSVDVVMGDASQSDLISLIRTAKSHLKKKSELNNKLKKPKGRISKPAVKKSPIRKGQVKAGEGNANGKKKPTVK
ncbi:hypothetical protein OnM2_067064 [Erysiphe neolycopersici]|uniref:Uncharacterized protein n=1 Tax=Erysiphe neolycopersici TaxID=212602 RepID=A0A420HM48_9PEZI|nr:hypothetical protein OnM2_067064 [Erysiphe neolycopersici]